MRRTLPTFLTLTLLWTAGTSGAATFSTSTLDAPAGSPTGPAPPPSWLAKGHWATMDNGVDFTSSYRQDLSGHPSSFRALQTEPVDAKYTVTVGNLPAPAGGELALARLVLTSGDGWFTAVDRQASSSNWTWSSAAVGQHLLVTVQRKCTADYAWVDVAGPFDAVGQGRTWTAPGLTSMYRFEQAVTPQGRITTYGLRADEYQLKVSGAASDLVGCALRVAFDIDLEAVDENYNVDRQTICEDETTELECVTEFRWILKPTTLLFERYDQSGTPQAAQSQTRPVLYLPVADFTPQQFATLASLAAHIDGLASGTDVGPMVVDVAGRQYGLAGRTEDGGFLAPLHDLQDPSLSKCLLVR